MVVSDFALDASFTNKCVNKALHPIKQMKEYDKDLSFERKRSASRFN